MIADVQRGTRMEKFLLRNAWGASMSLSFRSGDITMAFGTLSFFMADEHKTVRVDVGQDMLCQDGRPTTDDEEWLRATAPRNRRCLEQITAFKYDEGDYRVEVRVPVVITLRPISPKWLRATRSLSASCPPQHHEGQPGGSCGAQEVTSFMCVK